jgi:hypothetical protein
MEIGLPILFFAVVLFFYCTGGAWMLLVAGYPVHRLVGADEFAPFHRAFGRRLVPAFVVPGFAAYALTFALVAYRPYGVTFGMALAAAACSVVNIGVSLLYVVPKRRALAREGKNEAGIHALVRAHFVRTMAWTTGSVLLLMMMVNAIFS